MGNKDHSPYLKQAIELAIQAVDEDRGGPFGAVVVLDGRVIGAACNEVTSRNDPTAHAEVLAIRAACEDLGRFHLEGAVLYASCEPCPMCLSAAYWAHVGAIYHASGTEAAARAGFDDDEIYRELRREAGKRRVPLVEVTMTGGSEPFARWVKSTTKKMY